MLNYIIDSNNTLWLFERDGDIKAYSILKSGAEIQLSLLNTYEHNERILYCFHENDVVYFIDSSFTLFEFNLMQEKKDYIFNLQGIVARRGDVSSIIKQGDDYYIGFKTNGLIALRSIPDRIEKFNIEAIDIQSGIFCLLKDKHQDIIWVGTDGQGVYLYFNDAYSIKSAVFNNIPYKIEKPVRAIILDKENTLWIGTKGDGILKLINYNNKQNIADSDMQYLTSENSDLSDNSVYAFAASSKNLLWIGHDEGLNYYSYSSRQIRKIDLKYQGNKIKYIHSIYEVNDTTLWLASVGMGIIKATIGGQYNNPVLKNIQQFQIHDGSIAYNYFFTIHANDDSDIWFGNRGYGAFKVDPVTFQLSSVQFGKNQNNQLLNDVFAIIRDEKGNLWCGTSMGLVKRTPDNKISVFNENLGFNNNSIHGILRNSRNNLWLSTNRGIIRFDMKKETFQTYNENYGLMITEFSDGAFYKDARTGNLYFGGIGGFVVIDDTESKKNDYYPPIIFNSLSIFGKEYNIYDFFQEKGNQEVLQLNYNQNFFSIYFSTNDYINGNNYSYYYRLGELNENWIDNNEARHISFTNMKPGKYTLQVKYLNRVTGQESPAYQIVLNILPPWYLSLTAYIIYFILIIISLMLTAYFLVRREKKRRMAMLEKLKIKHQEEVHESKLRFFTNIAHEFCTPLTLIYGPCNRILSYNASDRFVKENTKVIQRNAERLNGLIQELIEFRRIETENRKPQIEEVSVSQLSYDIIKSFSEIMDSKGFHFEHQIQPELNWNIDKSFIYTVVTNLLSNALKYTSYSGIIKMKVETKNDWLEITINNTGKGIRKEDYDHIFDRYSILDNFENKEDKSIMRNGLGLAISYNLIKLLKGEIVIESELNSNTSFIIRVPQNEPTKHTESSYRVPPAMIPQETVGSLIELPQYPMSQNKQTIFIIDDDIEILWLICEIFKEQYNVVPFNTISSINELLKNIYPDIIISDIMMSGMDGISIVKQIKVNKSTSHIPLILISAKHDMEEQIKGVDAGAELYITKPFNIDFLKATVSRLIKQKENLKDYFTSPLSAFDLLGGKKIHKEDKELIEKILLVINEHLREKYLSANFIACELNMSTRQLYRKISDLCETTLADMIKECKLHVAKKLLLNTQMTIDEIAYNSGFSNRATFYNVFSAKYSSTPKEYRKKSLLGD
jgi:signal transduction histidine kinase/DNA-binding response OmpR family regulator/ligand-binding sensor domain-containing protein